MMLKDAAKIHGGLTTTSKMPCKSYSLPTIACKTGYAMAKVKGSVCADCYANKNLYRTFANSIEPAQHARLVSLDDLYWVDAMVASIGQDAYFRWHDSGDLQSVAHLELICDVCRRTPNTLHWLPTREYAMVKGVSLPDNLVVRLSAMFPDVPVKVPSSLQGVPGIATSNVHTLTPLGVECQANQRGGKCGDCRACWNRDINAVSYRKH